MSKNYSKEQLRSLVNKDLALIVELKDRNAYLGSLAERGYPKGGLYVTRNLNNDVIGFSRSHIKRIILLPDGIVWPKDSFEAKGKKLDIFELNDLINKTGYEFI